MRVLLDTHAFLWWLFDDPQLSFPAREVLSERQHRVYVSAASAWEICTKYRLGKLPAAGQLVEDVAGWVARAGFTELPISLLHAQRAGGWSNAHRDPFDRMLAAQSVVETLPVVSRDAVLDSFGVERFW